MGMFSSNKKAATSAVPTRHDLQKALFVVGCAMCMADGEADDTEIRRMELVAARMPLFANNSTEEDTAVMHEAGAAYDEDATKAVGWATDILQHGCWNKAAICFMSEIIMADGEIEQSEMDIATDLCHDLNVEIDEAQAIFATFQIYYQQYEG